MSINKSKPTNTSKHTSDHNEDNKEVDLLLLLSFIMRGWKTVLICALLGLLLGIIYSRYVQPTYQTDALVQIDEKSKGITGLGANISDLVGEDVSPAQTERELINSRMVLQPVVDALQLDISLKDPNIGFIDRIQSGSVPTQINTENNVTLDTVSGPVSVSAFEVPQAYIGKEFQLTSTETGFQLSHDTDTFNGQIGKPTTFSTKNGDIHIHVQSLPTNPYPINISKRSVKSATDALNSALSVSERGTQTGIIQLTLTGPNQDQVTNTLEHIVTSYVNKNQDRGSQQTTTTIEFMESQIPALRKTLEESEAAFNAFREKYGTIDVSKEAELLLTENAQIDTQLNQLNLKKAELETFYTAEHPLVTQINEQLDVLNKRKQEIQKTTAQLPEIQRQFMQLSEDMGINREIYLTMLKNYEQLKIARAGEIGYVSVIDRPISTFQPIAPKKQQIWLLALLIGTTLGCAIVLLKNLMRHTVNDPEVIESKTGVPVIATIPRSKAIQRLGKHKKGGDRLLAMVDHNSLSYEGIKSLRTYLMFGMPNTSPVGIPASNTPQGRVILISGESPDIGKSFITANLTETFSQLDKKILLIDGDMRLGELHKTFSVSENTGLSDYLLVDDAQPKGYIQKTSFENIDFMPRGSHSHNPSSLLSTDRLEVLMLQLVSMYDYIIIDSPPVLAATDAIIIAQYADKVLMVTRYGQSIQGQLAYAIKQMNKGNITVDGIVLNDMTKNLMDKYSYHYSYAYTPNNATKK